MLPCMFRLPLNFLHGNTQSVRLDSSPHLGTVRAAIPVGRCFVSLCIGVTLSIWRHRRASLHSPAHGHLGRFQFGAVVNSNAVSNLVRVFATHGQALLLVIYLGLQLRHMVYICSILVDTDSFSK